MATVSDDAAELTMSSGVDQAVGGERVAVLPLTERVLRRLPGPRVAWMVAWALVAPFRLVALLAVLTMTGDARSPAEIANAFLREGQATFGYVVLVALWGTPRLVRRVTALAPAIDRLVPAGPDAWPFARLTSERGPVALAALSVALATPSTIAEFGPAVGLVDIPLLFVVTLPIMTFLWTYGAILVGLDRLGQSRLALDLFPQDRSLGLSPVGGAAIAGFWLVIVAAAPLLILGTSDLTTLAMSVGIVLIAVCLFVLSMVRLHGQMRTAKTHYLAMTRTLVAEAYAPVRTSADLSTLQTNSAALNAAQSLAERAERILEWPIDERMIASMTVVVTGVVTSLIVRVVLDALGV
jgi:hypothetical protein